jgi:hypothetical protein
MMNRYNISINYKLKSIQNNHWARKKILEQNNDGNLSVGTRCLMAMLEGRGGPTHVGKRLKPETKVTECHVPKFQILECD